MKTTPTPLATPFPTPSPWGSSPTASSARQMAAKDQATQISFTTKEGDLVSFSASILQASRSASTDTGTSRTFTAASLEVDSYALTVQGDLNEEELRDIDHFMTKLTAIASDFFAGDYGQALAGATSLGDLGSIAKLRAEFSTSSALTSQTQISGGHPLPDWRALPTHDLPTFAADLNRLYTESLQSRWQQISDYLKQRLSPDLDSPKSTPELDAPPPVAPPSPPLLAPTSPLLRMVEQAQSFLGNHPRLSPFLLPLANRAFDQAADLAQTAGKPPRHPPRPLLAELSGYLLG